MSCDQSVILCRRDGAVAWLTMNRPAARNSLSLEMLTTLRREIERLGAARGVHAIIIAAKGPAFCAGHDLKELTAARANADQGKAFIARTMTACCRLMMAIVGCPKPVIAAVQGTATAAGCQLVASCDLALASRNAGFATPGVNIGLFCSTPMVALSRNVSRKAAMQMLLTGEMIPAEKALQFGLINGVTTPDALADETEELARRIAGKAPATVKIGKEAFYAQCDLPLQDAYDYTSQVMLTNMMMPDAEEGIGAFIEKRPPIWRPL